jgi:hydroxymethylpyrimidine pyrophosphatase-like HAD family hydrolase
VEAKSHKRRIAVDFDGTLATYNGWKGVDHLGEPIPEMVEKVKTALAQGDEVTIFTARVNPGDGNYKEALEATISLISIGQWSLKHVGKLLPITCQKSKHWDEFWDDRAKEVIPNTGVFIQELVGALK